MVKKRKKSEFQIFDPRCSMLVKEERRKMRDEIKASI